MAEEDGRAPKALSEKPELEDHLVWVYNAFSRISTDRQYFESGGCTTISWSAVNDYAIRYGIDDLDDFTRFYNLISALDAVYLRDQSEKLKARAAASGKG